MDVLDQLRRVSLQRAGEAFHSVDYWSPMQWGCAIAGEAGELCNLVKKLERGRDDDPDDINAIADEAADVVIYLDLLCARLGIDLASAIPIKFDKTSEKVGSSIRFR